MEQTQEEREELAQETSTVVSASAIQIQAAAKEDLNYLALLCIPHVFRYVFPPVFIAVWQWLRKWAHTEREFPKLVLGLPRGFGKSIVIKLFVAYCIFFTDKKYIVICCATEPKAQNMLADICNILSSSTVRQTFGDWDAQIDTDRVNLKKFNFRGRGIVLQAAGTGTDIRGANILDQRPDVIIFDDVQKREDANSETEAKHLRTWFYDTAMKVRSPFGCMYLFLGNMYPTPYSMLRELCGQSQWLKFVTGAILENGESLWEDLYPLKQLIAEYEADKEAGREASFMAEMMNDPTVSQATSIDVGLIPQTKFTDPADIHQGNFIVIDPSTGQDGKDPVAIGYFEIFDTVPVAKKATQGAFSPAEMIRQTLIMAMENDCADVFIEAVAYQATAIFWADFYLKELGIEGIAFHPVHPKGGSKNSKIVNTVFPLLLAGEVQLAPEVRSLFTSQAADFDITTTKNRDDLLDLIYYADQIRAEHSVYLADRAYLNRQQYHNAPLLSGIETSAF